MSQKKDQCTEIAKGISEDPCCLEGDWVQAIAKAITIVPKTIPDKESILKRVVTILLRGW